MADTGSSDDINIVVEMDRSPGSDQYYGFSADYDNWTDTRRGLIEQGDTPNVNWGMSIGEVNMGELTTLQSFIEWGVSTYPAEKYA